MSDIFAGNERGPPPFVNFTNSSSALDDDAFPYDEAMFTVDTASAQTILILSAASVSIIKTMLASGAYSYFHPAMSVLSLGLLCTAFWVFRTNDYAEESDLDENDPDAFYGDSLFLYTFTYFAGCVIEFVNVLLTFKTVRIYYAMKDLFPEETRDDTKQTAANRTRCITVFGSIIPLLVPLLSFNKANWKTQNVLPYNFDGQDDQLLLIGCYHAMLAIFATFVATFIEREFTLVKVLGGASQLLFLVKSGLAYIVLVHVDDRGAGGLTFLSLITTFQGIEFISEVSRLVEWYALADPPEEEECEDPSPEQRPEETDHYTLTEHTEQDPAFPIHATSNVATDNDSILESESLTIGTYSIEERHVANDVEAAAKAGGGERSVSASVDQNMSIVSEGLVEEEDFDNMSLDVGDLYTMKQ